MDNVLSELLENDELDPTIRQAITEEWNKKLEEAKAQIREQVEDEVRADFAKRFEHDREKMVEAMDKFINEAVERELREFAEDRKSLFDTRAKLARQIRETKQQAAERTAKQAEVLEAFTLKMINKELGEFVQDKKALEEKRIEIENKLEEERSALNELTAERIQKLEAFAISKLTEELGEFEDDKRSLVEQKIKMAKEAKAKLNETRANFVKRSSALVEKTLRNVLRKEFTQFREDIRLARENHFGRKIFESFAAEYMTSYLAEGSEVKKLQGLLEQSKQQTQNALTQLTEQQEEIKKLAQKVALTEDHAKRSKIMNELLTPLGREVRGVMEELLTTVKTEKLQESFKKYLPTVLKDSKNRRPLSEAVQSSAQATVVTGNREKTATVEEVTEDSTPSTAEIVRIRALAGLK